MCVTGLGRDGNAGKFSGQLWGNGEFGFAVQRSFRISSSGELGRRTAKERRIYRLSVSSLSETDKREGIRHYEAIDLSLGTQPKSPLELSEKTFENLGLSLLANSHTKAKRGSKGITPYAAKLVRNACVRLEKDFGKDRISFLTVTLPDLDKENLDGAIASWGEIVRKYHQWIRRTLIARGLPPHIVGVTEVQTERYHKYGFLGYHLHLAFVGRQAYRGWAIDKLEFREAWNRILKAHLPHPESVRYWNASARVERVEYSLEGYLGKYLTKGSREVKTVALEHGEEFLVSSWHTISKELRNKVLRERIRGNQAVFNFIAELCESALDEVFIYRRKIHIEDGSIKIPWGWTGKLSKWGIQVIKDFISIR